MSDPVQLEEKSGKSKKSNKSKRSNQNQENNEVVSNNSKVKNNNENNENTENKPVISQPVLSTRAYLEQNVTPVVQEALLECARKRPTNPLEFVGQYILDRAHGK